MRSTQNNYIRSFGNWVFCFLIIWIFSGVGVAQQSHPNRLFKFGVNIGKETIDQWKDMRKHPILKLSDTDGLTYIRYFYQLDDDFKNRLDPIDTYIDYNGLGGRWSAMEGHYYRLKKLDRKLYDVRITPTRILNDKGKFLKFPHKDYRLGTVGKNKKEAVAVWTEWAKYFYEMYGQSVTLEVGNEAWGNIGVLGMYQRYLGLKTQPIRLAAPALQAVNPNSRWKCKKCKYETGDYYKLYPFLLHLPRNSHSYSFKPKTINWLHPEHEDSEFWDFMGFEGSPTDITEIGWDRTVGEREQAAYAARALFIASKYDWVKRLYFYELVSQKNGAKNLYGDSGIFKVGGAGRTIDERPSLYFRTLLQIKELLGDWHYVKTIQEDEEAYIYLISDGKKQQLLAWIPQKGIQESSIPFQYFVTGSYTELNGNTSEKNKYEKFPYHTCNELPLSGIPRIFMIDEGAMPPH